MDNYKIPVSPLNKIALSFSGGGYRAATFHLGAISYLNRLKFQEKPLLENVRMISTVSGGTITGVIYALMKQQGHSFEEIYRFILTRLQKTDLVKSGITKLNPGTVWDNEYKRKNLINAFAEIYDQEFTLGATFSVFNTMNSHLEAVVFNSTEFSHGIDFRFRNKAAGYCGNYYLQVAGSCAGEVKLADAIASSSCFPGGFEPMIWPHDFVHTGAAKLMELAKSSGPVGIMDGGIYDNQGVNAILEYNNGKDKPCFDLVILSDVASPYVNAYEPAKDQPKQGFRKYNLKQLFGKVTRINRFVNLGLAGVLVICALVPLFFGYNNSWYTGLFIGLSISGLALLILKIIAGVTVKKWVANVPGFLHKAIPAFFLERFALLNIEELSFRRIEPLLLDRINSMITLVSCVFLKVVRKLNYNQLYDNDLYHYRRISNLINELTEADYNNRLQRAAQKHQASKFDKTKSILQGSYHDVVGPHLNQIAEDAAGFGTTLWFTDQEKLSGMLDKLIAAGQFTLCYNILEYLETILFTRDNGYAELDPAVKNELIALCEQCKSDWLKFKDDPLFMVNEMIAPAKV